MQSQGYERFGVYGFSIDYPQVCRVEFNSKSKREEGDVIFHFPDKEKIFLSWGSLEKARKKFRSVEDQAAQSLERIKKSGSVSSYELIFHGSLMVNSHRGDYNRVKFREITSRLFAGRTVGREGASLHLHCENSSRYFVLYGMFADASSDDYEKTLKAMASSFRCH